MNSKSLEEEHSEEAIKERIESNNTESDLGDMVLGSIDGTVTTFAIVSGVAGSNIESGVLVAFILGFANVLADGFSMGASNYLKARSEWQQVNKFRKIEESHIDKIPEGEKEEVREIFSRKGFSNEMLDQIVSIITKDKKVWIDTMLTEEWGLRLNPPNPIRSGLITFFAFIIAGIIPLLPLLLGILSNIEANSIFIISAILASITFIITGCLRGKILHESILKNGFETFLIGSIAAGLAYFVGEILSNLI